MRKIGVPFYLFFKLIKKSHENDINLSILLNLFSLIKIGRKIHHQAHLPSLLFPLNYEGDIQYKKGKGESLIIFILSRKLSTTFKYGTFMSHPLIVGHFLDSYPNYQHESSHSFIESVSNLIGYPYNI